MTTLELLVFAFSAISEIAKAALDTQDGKVTPEQALERIRSAIEATKGVDAKADAALAARFGEEDS